MFTPKICTEIRVKIRNNSPDLTVDGSQCEIHSKIRTINAHLATDFSVDYKCERTLKVCSVPYVAGFFGFSLQITFFGNAKMRKVPQNRRADSARGLRSHQQWKLSPRCEHDL